MLRFVTIVTPDFWPGFAALVQSLGENSGIDFEIYPICDENHIPQKWLETRTEKIHPLPLTILPHISVLSSQNQGIRMENALQKLGIFALPNDFGKCIYIDSDIICLNDISLLRDELPLTLTPDNALMSEQVPADPLRNPDFEFNTGLIVFEPDVNIFNDLNATYFERHHERTHKGDQDIINLWIHANQIAIKCLGSEWNFTKRYQDSLGASHCKTLLSKIKFLHFVGMKPWASNVKVTTFRECHYRWMEEIWWDYFDRSNFACYMKNAPRRSIAFKRKWILPWSKPVILREHMRRARALLSRIITIKRTN